MVSVFAFADWVIIALQVCAGGRLGLGAEQHGRDLHGALHKHGELVVRDGVLAGVVHALRHSVAREGKADARK